MEGNPTEQADLEAQISLGKGDIQRKLEEVDAKLAKNAQQMADFRKRINDTVQKLERGEPLIIPIGEGEFGPIYDQFRGKPQEAVDFLLAEKNGEAIGALSHKDIGEIDLVWGKEGTGHSDGYGLSKLAKYHPEVLDKLQPILDDMEVVNRNTNRVNLESPKYQATVRLTWNNERKNWLLTAFEKRNSAIDNTTDTGETTISGKQNDTATLQSTASENKDTTSIPKNQISDEEIFNTPTLPTNEDIPFMIEQKPTEQAVSETEQNFNREVFDAFAGHLGETLGAESVVTDAAEAQRVLEWHQAVGERLRTAVSENAEIAAERADIERVAKENGTWLKASNGKDTNLTERQWIDVRTSRFKNWFGDWEVANKEVENVVIPLDTKITSRKEALEYLKSLQQPFHNIDQGTDIYVSRANARHSMSFRNEDQIKAIGAIDKIIQNAVYVGDVEIDADEIESVKAVHIYYCPIKIGNRQYSARMVVKEYFEGNQVLNELHLYNYQLRKMAPIAQSTSQSLLAHPTGTINRYKVSDLIHNTQELDQKNVNNSSKVVDANDDPKVAYHGTPNQFNTFNRELIGSSTDRGIWGRGFYFTSNLTKSNYLGIKNNTLTREHPKKGGGNKKNSIFVL